MLTVRLATTPGYGSLQQTPQTGGKVRLKIEGIHSILRGHPRAPIQDFVFPQPSSVGSAVVQMPPGAGALRLVLECGSDSLTWHVGPVGPDDILSLSGGEAPAVGGGGGSGASLYVGGIYHVGRQQGGNPCQVACANGQIVPDECCIECIDGLTTLKFCC